MRECLEYWGWQWLGNGCNVQRHKAWLAILEIWNVLEILLVLRIVMCLEGFLTSYRLQKRT